jgi:hypothetical protein
MRHLARLQIHGDNLGHVSSVARVLLRKGVRQGVIGIDPDGGAHHSRQDLQQLAGAVQDVQLRVLPQQVERVKDRCQATPMHGRIPGLHQQGIVIQVDLAHPRGFLGLGGQGGSQTQGIFIERGKVAMKVRLQEQLPRILCGVLRIGRP